MNNSSSDTRIIKIFSELKIFNICCARPTHARDTAVMHTCGEMEIVKCLWWFNDLYQFLNLFWQNNIFTTHTRDYSEVRRSRRCYKSYSVLLQIYVIACLSSNGQNSFVTSLETWILDERKIQVTYEWVWLTMNWTNMKIKNQQSTDRDWGWCDMGEAAQV